MMKTLLLTISVAAIFAAGVVQAAEQHAAAASQVTTGDIKAGEQKASTICIACHGPQGNSLVPIWPKLAGQHPDYIKKQIMDFKAGNRYNVQMTPMAMPLTDQEVADVAAYFSSQKQSGGTADSELTKLGESIYRAGNPTTGVPACSGCHGPAGLGQGLSRFPRLSGQHAGYIKQTLGYFQKQERANDPNGMMRGVTARMTDQEMTAVSQYIQGLAAK
ncbi:c-type cytochrome [Chromatium okenii]|uniref:Cytochrome c4 n=1 Tax=Chromatium okenii TaxID=61644 RepID=A0A2S7XTY9_9GAMM|nr:c-type cytochrome [Chromatium okenii]MBV5311084.1 cytochrome c4 [Chromatium okenii]PQJ97205.1 cytochrome c4 [Chromatium okenii]PQJ97539.1 cytochrome c4 [Chromatium okenii]